MMKDFSRDHLAPIVRLANGGIDANRPAALVVYVLAGTGIALFLMPRPTVLLAPASVARFGLVVHGIDDFTNRSMLRQWPSLPEAASGPVASAAPAAAVRGVSW